MKRARLVLAAAVIVLGGLALPALRDRGGDGRPASFAELAAKNYRVLTPRQSRELRRFAEREYRCLAAHDAGVSPPVASPTRITIRAPNRAARLLARLLVACDGVVGTPPAEASLQARPAQVVLYLPRWCLLDPNQVPPAAP